MEDDLYYATATFRQIHAAPARDKEEDLAVVYDQVNVGHVCTTAPENTSRKSGEAGLHPLLCALAAALGIACIALASVVIVLYSRFGAVTSEREGEIENLTAQVLLLKTDMAHLEGKMEELAREKDQLNWTVGVILQYDVFSVKARCPQKVCLPCQDGWKRFKSKCYLFEESTYYTRWKSWEAGQDECRKLQANLAVIETPEEQEFIHNNTKEYDDDAHGYWIGLSSRKTGGLWMWVNGSNVTVEYWKSPNPGYKISCALTLPKGNALASWNKASCDMKNRWICETTALMKSE